MDNYAMLKEAGFSPAALAVIEDPARIFDLSTAERRAVEAEINELWAGMTFND
jgi:hypothetical protein